MAEIPNDIPGNSHKAQQATSKSAGQGDGRPPIPVFEGKTAGAARKPKSSVWQWFKKMFLSDRKPSEIIKEVVEYRIVPGIKDNFRNSAMATLDSFIYPGSGPAGPSNSSNGVNYNKIFNSQPSRSAPVQQTANNQKEDEINKGFNNPCFRTHMEAQTFLGLLKSYDYPTLSVHTLYMMRSEHIDYTWDAYGWTKEEISALGPGCIRPINNPDWPWMIDLPRAHVIA